MNAPNANAVTHHLYFESSFSPETFAVYNINEKHALDESLNASRVQHFVRRLQSQYSFLPDEVLPRMEKILCKLHYGWCSHAMELIKGDLQLIKAERSKNTQNDILIADIGKAIEKLLDTFEVAMLIDQIEKKAHSTRARMRGMFLDDAKPSDPLSCWKIALVHPESSQNIRPLANGCGVPGALPSVLHRLEPPDDISECWQLFFEVLTRSYQSASYLVQENIETEKGHLDCSHKPEIRRVLKFINEEEGKYLMAHIVRVSVLYQPVTEGQVIKWPPISYKI